MEHIIDQWRDVYERSVAYDQEKADLLRMEEKARQQAAAEQWWHDYQTKRITKDMGATFEQWWEEVRKSAPQYGVNPDDLAPGLYRHLYEGCNSPETAILDMW